MNQQERLEYLVEQFREDSEGYRNMIIPADIEGNSPVNLFFMWSFDLFI